MANEEHLKIIKRGAIPWNKWRLKNPEIRPDLRNANLSGANLRQVRRGEPFVYVSLQQANLSKADLRGANLSDADLYGADLSRAGLIGTIFNKANLYKTNLSGAVARNATFCGAYLGSAIFSRTDLQGADLTESIMAGTVIARVDLSSVNGLDTIQHEGPSMISIDTIYRYKGKIPEIFLRGVGVPEPFIANIKTLLSAMEPIQFYSCFISHSSRDQEFATRLHSDLQRSGIRCWFAPKDLPIGSETRSGIDDAIRSHDKLLVVLSQNSVKSAWVKKEVETAFDKENREKIIVLFPIRLDDTVMNTSTAWAADIRRMRNIGDFSNWKNDDSYREAFDRLLRDLKAEPKA